MEVIAYNEAPVTFSGGDPLAQAEPLAHLINRIKSELGYNVWCYTGYTWEQVKQKPNLMSAVRQLDVLVDSPFIMDERNTKLRFRGSNNQRLIDVQASLAKGEVTLWHD